MKSLIFAFVLKAKQEQVLPRLWPNWTDTMKCWLLCIWNTIPASRGKQRHCSWQCRGLCWWKRSLDASASLRAAHHCLQLGSSDWPLRQAQAPGFIPYFLYRKPLLWSIHDEGGQAAAEVGLCSAARTTRSTRCLNQPVLSWSFLCSI